MTITGVSQQGYATDGPWRSALAGGKQTDSSGVGQDPATDAAAGLADKKTSPEVQRQIRELKQIDAQVHQHEAAHLAVAGQYARGGAHYSYVTGPDGQMYAVSGEVALDLTPIPDDPGATIQKEEVIERAALAPADPSSQDRQVAAAAQQLESEARLELMQEIMQRQSQSRTATVANVAAYKDHQPVPRSKLNLTT